MADITFDNADTQVATTKLPAQLQYPADYDSYGGPMIVFTEYEYGRPDRTQDATRTATGTTIALPVPQDLMTAYQADWQQVNLGPIGNQIRKMSTVAGKAFDSAQGISPGIGPTENDRVSAMLASIPGYLWEHIGEIGSAIGVDAMGAFQVTNAVLQGQGMARNPFVATFFSSMALKHYQFQWSFFARNFQESQQIFNIIYAFKMGMHPTYYDQLANNLFVYPNLYGLKFTEPAYLFNFGMCAIRDFAIQYHGEGTPLYFEHEGRKLPASITVGITLGEIEVNTRETIERDHR